MYCLDLIPLRKRKLTEKETPRPISGGESSLLSFQCLELVSSLIERFFIPSKMIWPFHHWIVLILIDPSLHWATPICPPRRLSPIRLWPRRRFNRSPLQQHCLWSSFSPLSLCCVSSAIFSLFSRCSHFDRYALFKTFSSSRSRSPTCSLLSWWCPFISSLIFSNDGYLVSSTWTMWRDDDSLRMLPFLGQIFCQVFVTSDVLLCTSSILNLCAIAVRLHSLHHRENPRPMISFPSMSSLIVIGPLVIRFSMLVSAPFDESWRW